MSTHGFLILQTLSTLIMQIFRSILVTCLVIGLCFLSVLLWFRSQTGFGLFGHSTTWQVSWLHLSLKSMRISCIAVDIVTARLVLLVLNIRLGFPMLASLADHVSDSEKRVNFADEQVKKGDYVYIMRTIWQKFLAISMKICRSDICTFLLYAYMEDTPILFNILDSEK